MLTSGNDTIKGTASGNDIIIGTNKGNDTIYGLGGDDFIKGSAGSDFIDGGAGWNTLAYTETFYNSDGVKSGIMVDVVGGKVKNSWGGTDTVLNIRGYEGTNLFDRFYGGKGGDSFMGLKGADKLVGGKGIDEARYHKDAKFGATHGIVADLAKGTIEDGFGTVDIVESIERIVGTHSRDVFKGNGADNYFRGWAAETASTAVMGKIRSASISGKMSKGRPGLSSICARRPARLSMTAMAIQKT